MVVPTCPICTSRKWRKAAGTGELICSEGHVLQGYRNETIEVNELGAHAVHVRRLRTGSRRKARERDNPHIYYGPRARYFYYQCRQLALRHQIDRLITEWGLPEEARNVCRTIWLLSLEILPKKPPPEPWIYAQMELEPNAVDSSQQKGSSSTAKLHHEDKDIKMQDLDKPADSETSDEDGDEDEDTRMNSAEIDLEIEKLMFETSDTEPEPESNEKEPAKGQKTTSSAIRDHLYHSTAMNISMLVLTCWWFRVPVMYSDFINAINCYKIPYLDVVRLLPENMKMHLSLALRQELNPPHAPSVTELHIVTRRIARRLHAVHGVHIPEFNAAPVLWRGVRALRGPPTLYAMAKKMMERLEVPLTVHPSLAPKPSLGRSGYGGDWVPVEVAMAAVMVVILKLVYGFQDGVRVVPDNGDPASQFPDFVSYMQGLRREKAKRQTDFDSLLSQSNERTADTLCDKDMDAYLEVAERALDTWSMGEAKSMPFKSLMAIYSDVCSQSQHGSAATFVPENLELPEALERPRLERDEKDEITKPPGKVIPRYSHDDPLGVFPPDYALLLEVASIWTGVEQSIVNRLVGIFERRLSRYFPKERKRVDHDSETDKERIEIDQPGSEEDSLSEDGVEYDDQHDDKRDTKVKTTRMHKVGSGSWRKKVHNRLSKGKGAYKESLLPLDEPESEDDNPALPRDHNSYRSAVPP